jgi:hypothetical protein
MKGCAMISRSPFVLCCHSAMVRKHQTAGAQLRTGES